MNSRTRSRPTIIDVAASAGVSKSLVSLVLRGATAVSDEKRRLVLAAVAELGYRPNGAARSLVQRRSNLLGMLLRNLHDAALAEIVDGVQAEAGSRGYNTIMSVVDHHALAARGALDTLLELRIDGLVLANTMPDATTITAASKELPIVLVTRRTRIAGVDSICNNDAMGASMVVQHLANLGHQRIAHIDGGTGAGAAERRKGYARAMQRRGLDAHLRIVSGNDSEDGGRQGIAALYGSGVHPTAIFVAHDLAALGALSALAERGLRVPHDVSVAGYDNKALSAVSQINLTTVGQPHPEMGRQAVALLLERLTGERDTARHVLLPPSLIVRGTTAARRPSSDGN